MTTLEEKINSISEDVAAEFNELPKEERKRISKYTSRMQILTIYQMLLKDKDLTTDRWRKKQRKWLENCVEIFRKEWSDEE